MTHPIEPEHEDTRDVFRALLATVPEAEQDAWSARWLEARRVEMRRRDYDDRWTQSLMGVARFGQ